LRIARYSGARKHSAVHDKGAIMRDRGFWVVLLAIIGIGCIVLLLGEMRIRQFQKQESQLLEEIARLEEENANLEVNYKKALADPEYLEKIIRSLGYVKKGEIVYKINEDSSGWKR